MQLVNETLPLTMARAQADDIGRIPAEVAGGDIVFAAGDEKMDEGSPEPPFPHGTGCRGVSTAP